MGEGLIVGRVIISQQQLILDVVLGRGEGSHCHGNRRTDGEWGRVGDSHLLIGSET